MKDTKTTRERLCRSNVSAKYELWKNDGRVYTKVEELEKLNFSMSLMSRKGVILTGCDGSGKTALVRIFAQQNLAAMYGVESVQCIQLNEDFGLNGESTEDTIFDNFSELCDEYSGNALVLHAKLKKTEKLAKNMEFWEKYAHEFEKYYDLKLFKIIFEFSVNNDGEWKGVKKACRGHEFDIISMKDGNYVSYVMDRIMPRVQEFSTKYKVRYSEDVLKYHMAVIAGDCSRTDDLSEYVKKIETVFEISQICGRDTLNKDIAEIVWNDRFTELSELGVSNFKVISFHEAGHALLIIVSQKDRIIDYVDVLPNCERNGVVSTHIKDTVRPTTNFNTLMASISTSLAGRLAEELYEKKKTLDNGAYNDLRNAMYLVNRMINGLGCSTVLGSNYIINNDERISEELTKHLEDEKREIIKKAEVETTELLKQHWVFVERLANRLCNEFVIVGDEVYKMWYEYLDELDIKME